MTHSRSTLDHLGITEWHLRHDGRNAPVQLDPLEAITSMATCTEKLSLQVKHCQRCALSQTRAHAIFGTGDINADLMLIGESPNQHDDTTGLAFSGPVGELLDKMLAAIGQTRHSVYLTTVVKCHPKHDRSPFNTEIAECSPYLQQQIDFVKPRLIMTLGPLAAQSLLHSTQPLTTLRGQTFSFGATGIPLIASFAPAYLLHNPGDKRNAFQDLLRVAALLKTNLD